LARSLAVREDFILHDVRKTPHRSGPELIPGTAFLVLALVLAGMALSRWSLVAPLKLPFFAFASVLFVVAGGFLSVTFTASARARGPLEKKAFVRKGAKHLHPVLERARRFTDRSRIHLVNIDWRGDWLPLAAAMLPCAAALFCLWRAWQLTGAAPSLRFDEWMGGAMIGLAFPVLVLERRFAGLSERNALAAPSLTRLIRLLLLELLGFALTCLFYGLGLPWALPVERAVLLFPALVAAELFLRACAYYFMPLPPLEDRQGHAGSLVAGLLRLQKPSLTGMNAAISKQFGIDLGRSWAIGFVRRASAPALIGLAVFAWLLSGVSALDLSQRAVYEAFGRPQTVFHSGLHVYLPWPFGRLRPVEYGVVREIPIVFASEDGTPPEVEARPGGQESIEGVPPAGADRLWDASHPSEASYLVASNRNGRENFEVVNIDLQILYRVGLSDKAAYNAVYNVEAPDALIRAAAGRMLARYFARYTMTDVLGQNREAFIRGFQKELQSRLDALSSGVDILGVVIEAIHPPPAAATAYQDVQASGIQAQIRVADARATAVAVVAQAQSDATDMKDIAIGNAEEIVDQAKIDTALFAADVTANRQYGAAFLLERRLTAVKDALQTRTPLTIIDSRIEPSQMPTLDYRATGSAPYVPPSATDDEQ
jgi:regulator of protease activity HflC (stomatin/prohibitin superfamily)